MEEESEYKLWDEILGDTLQAVGMSREEFFAGLNPRQATCYALGHLSEDLARKIAELTETPENIWLNLRKQQREYEKERGDH